MSFYALCRALYDLGDARARATYLLDREACVRGLDSLTESERRMILEIDIGGLHRAGVPIYLIRTLALIHHIGFEEVGVATGGKRVVRTPSSAGGGM